MSKKLKVGCIGLGMRGSYLYSTLIKNPNVEAYAACDEDPEKIEEFKKELEKENREYNIKYFTSYKELLESDVEAVVVATHISTHCDISIDCLNAGKHVLCEIPNISNVEEAKKLYRAVKAHPNQKFMVAENCCYWGFIESWKKMYDDGVLGEIVYAESDYLHQHVEVVPEGLTWRSYLPSITYITHNLGPLLYIMGDTCEEITGFIPNINPIEEVHPAPPNGVAMIKTKKGTLIKIFIGFGVHHEFTHNFAVYGSKGSLENQRGYGLDKNKTLASLSSIPHTHEKLVLPISVGFPGDAKADDGHGGADPRMLRAFVDCVIKDTKPPLDIDFGISIALSGIYADLSSKEGGKTYKMPDMSELE